MENFKSINIMAHFAEVDENNIVLRVVVVPDEEESRGQEFLSVDLGLGGTWLKTSYNTFQGKHMFGGIPFRKNFAGNNYIYDSERDAFIPPKPYPSWENIDEEKCIYLPPTPMPEVLPTDTFYYKWDEETQSWIKVDIEI
jgi:hypothetical protein